MADPVTGTRRHHGRPAPVLPDRKRTARDRPHPEQLDADEWALLEDMTPGERLAWLDDRARLAPPRRPRDV